MRSLRLCNVKGIYCGRISESLVQMPYLSFLDVIASDENEVLKLNVRVPSLQKLTQRGRLAEGALDETPPFQAGRGQNLYELHLFWSQLREDPLPPLSRLSNLTRLDLTTAYSGVTGWFPKLKVLCLRDLPDLSRLEIHQGAIEILEELILINLSSMTDVPPGIEFLTSLKNLGFYKISRDFLTSLRQCPAIRGKWRYSLRD